MTAYLDILTCSRPNSRHPRMALEERAKIFAPFSALRGFDISILTTEQDRVLTPRLILSQERMEELDRVLCGLQPSEMVELSFFEPVKTVGELELGTYRTVSAQMLRLDRENRLLHLSTGAVRVEDIVSVVGASAST